MNTIFDLGFHKGEDTVYYLMRGFRVVAVEANPDLFSAGVIKFRDALLSGKLFLLNAAVIGSQREEKEVMFYPHPTRTEWGSIDQRWIDRNEKIHQMPHSPAISVPTIKLPELISKYGCPYYLKIDLEGADEEVLLDLINCNSLPKYVSWETGKESFVSVIAQHYKLRKLGYSKFRIIDQSLIYTQIEINKEDGLVYNFLEGSSGAIPSEDYGKWKRFSYVVCLYAILFIFFKIIGPKSAFFRASKSKNKFLHYLPKKIQQFFSKKGIPFPGWYDSHAMLTN